MVMMRFGQIDSKGFGEKYVISEVEYGTGNTRIVFSRNSGKPWTDEEFEEMKKILLGEKDCQD